MPFNSNSGAAQGGVPVGGINFDPLVNIGDNFVAKRTAAAVLGKGDGLSESLLINLHALASFSNNVGNVLEGSTVDDVTLNWTFNRNGDDPSAQSIDQGVGVIPNADRQIVLGPGLGLVGDTTWTITADGDDVSYGAAAANQTQRSTTIDFQPAYYFGVSQNILATGADIEANFIGSEGISNSRARTYNFDASVGGGNNYLYIAYPTAFGNPPQTFFNGVQLNFNDYVIVNDDITNSEGFLRNFIIIRTNNTYNSNDIDWQIF